MNNRYLHAGLGFSFIIFFILTHFRSIVDPDLFWHLKMAETHLQLGKGQFSEIFSYTSPGTLFSNHEWLSQRLAYIMYSLGGFFSLQLLPIYSALTVMALAFLYNRKNAAICIQWAMMWFLIEAFYVRLAPRPGLVTLVALAVWFPMIEWVYLKNKNFIPKICFVIYLIVWNNLHAEALIGILLSVVYVLFRGDLKKNLYFLSAIALSVFVQKYPLSIFEHIFSDVTKGRDFITEWQATFPIFIQFKRWDKILFSSMVLVFPFFSKFLKKEPFKKQDLAVYFACMFISFTAIREFSWMIVCGFIAKKYAIKIEISQKKLLALVFALAAFIQLPWKYFSANQWVEEVSASHFPIEQVQFIKDQGLKGNVFTLYMNGGYAMFHLYPQCKVFIDSRNYAYSEKIRKDNERIVYGGDQALDLLEEYKVDILMIRDTYFYETNTSQRQWKKVFTDGHYAVFLKKDQIDKLIRN